MNPRQFDWAGRVRQHATALTSAAILGAVVLGVLWLASGAEDSPSELQLFLGRLHPLIVHLPIGFLLLTVLLEVLGAMRRFAVLREAVPLALFVTALSAIVAVLAGVLLGSSGGYNGSLVGWHERLGITLAAVVSLAAALRYVWRAGGVRWIRHAYTASLGAAVALLLVTGHLGGTLTRGPDYLTEYLPAPLEPIAALLTVERELAPPAFVHPDEAVVYEHLVAPVLQARCVSCHGPDKQKGDLRLDSPEGILAGGSSGPVIVPGRAAESRMIQRIWLPPEHEDVMPPRGRPPLSAAEAELLRWWVDRGASFDQVVGRETPPPGVLAIIEQVAGPPEERIPTVLRTEVPAPDSVALTAASEHWRIRPLAQGSNFLRARCHASECAGEHLQALVPLAQQLAELDLSGAAVDDGDLQVIGQFQHLVRLSLDRTAVTDAGLEALSGLRHLEYLNLYGTAVTDAGLASLEQLASLRSLYLWRTGATEQGAARLAERLPHIRVSLGTTPQQAGSTGEAEVSSEDAEATTELAGS